MDHFDVLCKVLEKMDPATYNDIITEKSLDIVAALTAITEDGMDGMSIYMDFILCAISADGKLAEEEYMLIAPSLAALFGREVTYDEAHPVQGDGSGGSGGVQEVRGPDG